MKHEDPLEKLKLLTDLSNARGVKFDHISVDEDGFYTITWQTTYCATFEDAVRAIKLRDDRGAA